MPTQRWKASSADISTDITRVENILRQDGDSLLTDSLLTAGVPEIFRHHGYRSFFFSREDEEPVHVHMDEDSLQVTLSDGRIVSAPLEWFPRLRDASSDQKSNWRFIGSGIGMHWEDIDEDISVRSLLMPAY